MPTNSPLAKFTRKRNFAKFKLKGVSALLRNMVYEGVLDKHQIYDLLFIAKMADNTLKYWNDHTESARKENAVG